MEEEILTLSTATIFEGEIEKVVEEKKEVIPPPRVSDLCNCFLFIKNNYYPDLPFMGEVMRNVTAVPTIGSVVYLSYNGLQHFAMVIDMDETSITLDESNYRPCLRTNRTIPKTDPRIIGYWKPL